MEKAVGKLRWRGQYIICRYYKANGEEASYKYYTAEYIKRLEEGTISEETKKQLDRLRQVFRLSRETKSII